MTDKVQKILSEIATRKLCTMDEHMAFYNDKANEDYRFLSEIEEIIKGMQEEPVSEELEEAADEYADGENPTCPCEECLIKTFKAGAEWQKEQDQSTIELAEDHAMLAGMEKMKEEMMEKAVEGGCFSYKNGFVHISCDVDEHLTDVKFGDKVKVIVIKED